MKIFYFVAGEGLGHATRSIPVIEYLSKYHTVTAFSSGRSHKVLKKHFSNTKKVVDFDLIYSNNKIELWNVIKHNFWKLKSMYRVWGKLKRFVVKEKPDIIISDFSIWPKLINRFLGIKYVTIDNNHLAVKIKERNLDSSELKKLKLYIDTFISNKNTLNIIPSFCDIKHKKNTIVINPIIRSGLVEAKQKRLKTKDHYIVYQTSTSYPNLIKKLKQLDEKFIVYGMDRNDRRNVRRLNLADHQKILFKKFNENEFFTDLATCKGVITNGGFSLISEAIYLNKPILSVPVKNQYEQILNAYLLEKNGYGMMGKINKESFNTFKSNMKHFEIRQRTANKYDPNTGLKLIDQIIRQ